MDRASALLKKAGSAVHNARDAAARKLEGGVDLEKLQQRANSAKNMLADNARAARAHVSHAVSEVVDHMSHKEVVVVDGRQLQLVKQLAEGGFGFVYLAQHQESGKQYALKRMFAQDRDSRALAEAEVSLMRSLEHPNVIKMLASAQGPRAGGGQGSEYLLVMEFASAGTLARWVTPDVEGAMPALPAEERMLACFHEACKGVAYLHSRTPPLIHYDLKLENVLETARGTCKLCDFGSASTRTFDARSSDRRARLEEEDRISRYSTMMNRSPEMCDLERGVVGTPSDVWALGCMLYTLLFQRHPFDGGGGNISALGILNGRWAVPASSRYSEGTSAVLRAALKADAASRATVTHLIPIITRAIADASEHLLTPVQRPHQRSAAPARAPAAAANWATFDDAFDSAMPPPTPTAPVTADLLGGGEPMPGPHEPAQQGGWATFEAEFGADLGAASTTQHPASPYPPPSSAAASAVDLLDPLATLSLAQGSGSGSGRTTAPIARSPSAPSVGASPPLAAAATVDLLGFDSSVAAVTSPNAELDGLFGPSPSPPNAAAPTTTPQQGAPPVLDVSDDPFGLGASFGASTPAPAATPTPTPSPMQDDFVGLFGAVTPAAASTPTAPPSVPSTLDPFAELMSPTAGGASGGASGGALAEMSSASGGSRKRRRPTASASAATSAVSRTPWQDPPSPLEVHAMASTPPVAMPSAFGAAVATEAAGPAGAGAAAGLLAGGATGGGMAAASPPPASTASVDLTMDSGSDDGEGHAPSGVRPLPGAMPMPLQGRSRPGDDPELDAYLASAPPELFDANTYRADQQRTQAAPVSAMLWTGPTARGVAAPSTRVEAPTARAPTHTLRAAVPMAPSTPGAARPMAMAPSSATAVWEVELCGQYQPYESVQQQALEAAYLRGSDTAMIRIRGSSYEVRLRGERRQRGLGSEAWRSRRVRRREPSAPRS